MAWSCLEHSEIERFKQLLQDGMALTCDMLTTMMFFGYSDDAIKSILKTANKYDSTVVKWMQHYFTVDELVEVLPHYQDDLPSDWPSNEDCARLKLWKALSKRKCYNVIAKFAPEIAEQKGAYRALIRVDFAKYAPICLKNEWLPYIMSAKDGWKYLIDNGKAGWVLKARCNLFPWNEAIAYCMQKGLDNELYAAECYDALLSHGRTEVFVKNHSGYSGFLSQYPELVDWEYLWENNQLSHDYLIEQALKNRNTPNNHEFLKRHTGIRQILFG